MDVAKTFSVIGAGSYGTALAIAVASKGINVLLHARNEETAKLLESERENKKYLSGVKFPDALHVTHDIKELVNFSKEILIVVPSCAFIETIHLIKPFLNNSHRISWATKGLDNETGDFLSNILKKELAPLDLPLAALSGPTFAKEMAMGMPTAIACAGTDDVFVDDLCNIMHNETLRVYKSHDLLSLQLGGAVKNVIAIGAGMSDGLGYGANARIALISRGLAEMVRLGLALGAGERGFMGLSGLGDLMLTCTDNQSRNRRFGYMVGKGMKAEDALKEIGQVVEGYHMVIDVVKLARKLNVDMPICTEIYEVLVNGKSVSSAAKSLLSRELTIE